MTAAIEFTATCGEHFYRDRRSGNIYHPRPIAPCYCRSQLQLWFPETSSALTVVLFRWERFFISGHFPAG
jgi:hypothetical protein